MYGITNIVTRSAPGSAQGAGTNTLSGQSGTGFQIALLARPMSPPQGVSASVSASLGSQTASLLLQTQDLSQTQAHGGGGGGGHHGGMKMMPGLEAEEAGESEEAQLLRRRKKLMQTSKAADLSETVEIDENGVVVTNAIKRSDAELPGKENKTNAG